MRKRKWLWMLLPCMLIIAIAITTLSFTFAFYTDRKEQSVTMRSATLDYYVTAQIGSSASFDNYGSDSDVCEIRFTLVNNSSNTIYNALGIGKDFMFDKTSYTDDIVFFPSSMNDSVIRSSISSNDYTRSYGNDDNFGYETGFGTIAVSPNSSRQFTVKVANKTNRNMGNVLRLQMLGAIYTGNGASGTGFVERLEDNDTAYLYYFMNTGDASNGVAQGVQTVTRDIEYMHETYSDVRSLVNLKDNIIEANRVWFFDANGRLSDYGLSLDGDTGKITGVPVNMPDNYAIKFMYFDTSAWYADWVDASARTDGTYVGTVNLNFTRVYYNISDVNIGSISSYTYDGTAKCPEPVITYNGKILTKDIDYELSYENNIDAGTGTIVVKGKDNFQGTTNKTFIINKAPSFVSSQPVAENLTYDGTQQDLVSAGIAFGGTLYYRVSKYKAVGGSITTYDDTWSTVVPVGNNAGTYTVEYYVKGNSNHSDSSVSSIDVIIARASYDSSVGMSGYTWGTTKSTPFVTNNPGNASVVYYVRSFETDFGTDYSTVTSTTYDVGEYYIYAVISATNNYESVVTDNTKFMISKNVSSVVSAPTANSLTYNGSIQTLTTEGSANYGVMQYRILSYTPNIGSKQTYDKSYSSSICTATAAGVYEVQYYVKGDVNHTDTAVGKVSITIARASFTSSVRINNYIWGDRKSVPSVTNNPGNGNVTYYGKSTSSGSATNWNNVTSTTYSAGVRYIYAEIEATNNYEACITGNTSFTIYKADASVTIAPTVKSGITYSGSMNKIINTGTANGGTLYYRVARYVPNIGSAVDFTDGWNDYMLYASYAGTYTVEYYVKGDENHNDTSVETLTVTIARNSFGSSTKVAIDNYIYNGTKSTPTILNPANDGSTVGNITYYGRAVSNGASTEWNDVTNITYDVGTHYVYAIIAATNNYNAYTTAETSFKVDAMNMSASDVVIGDISNYVFDGVAKRPVPDVTVNGKKLIYYTDYTCTWSDNINAGTASVTVTAKSSNYTGTSDPKTFTIEPLSISNAFSYNTDYKTYAHVEYNSLNTIVSYDGSDKKSLANADMLLIYDDAYEDDNGNWVSIEKALVKGTDYEISFPNNSSCVNVGVYNYVITGKGNYTGTLNGTLTIQKSDSSITSNPSANSLDYTGSSQTLVSSGSVSNGTMYYRVKSYTNTSNSVSNYNNSYSTTRPTGINAGTYVVEYYCKGNTGYNDTNSGTVSVTINRVASSYTTMPSVKTGLTYSGSSQYLVNAGSTSHGTIYYRQYQYKSMTVSSYTTYNNSYSTTRPSATAAGYYKIQYYIKGDNNHYDGNVTTTSDVTIVRKSINPTLSMSNYEYGGTKATPNVSGNTGNGTVTYYYRTTSGTSGGTNWNTVTTSSSLSPGTYYMYAVVTATNNYAQATTSAVSFEVTRNVSTVTLNFVQNYYTGNYYSFDGDGYNIHTVDITGEYDDGSEVNFASYGDESNRDSQASFDATCNYAYGTYDSNGNFSSSDWGHDIQDNYTTLFLKVNSDYTIIYYIAQEGTTEWNNPPSGFTEYGNFGEIGYNSSASSAFQHKEWSVTLNVDTLTRVNGVSSLSVPDIDGVDDILVIKDNSQSIIKDNLLSKMRSDVASTPIVEKLPIMTSSPSFTSAPIAASTVIPTIAPTDVPMVVNQNLMINQIKSVFTKDVQNENIVNETAEPMISPSPTVSPTVSPIISEKDEINSGNTLFDKFFNKIFHK